MIRSSDGSLGGSWLLTELTKGRLEKEIAVVGKGEGFGILISFFVVICLAFFVMIWKGVVRQVEELKNRTKRDMLWVEVAVKQTKIPRRKFPNSR